MQVMKSYRGAELGTTGSTLSTAISFRFSAKYTDDETALVMYPYRPYIPPLGRWISRDPMGEEGGRNLWVICYNDLQNAGDPTGLDCVRFVSKSVSGKYRVLSTVDDIHIIQKAGLGTIGIFSDGSYADEPVTVRNNVLDGCKHILIPLRIYIRAGLKQVHTSGEYSGYVKHAANMDGGAGPNPVRSETIEHERGHARAYWEKIRPKVLDVLDKFCCDNRDTAAVEADIRQKYALLLEDVDYVRTSADMANQATINWYRSDSSYEEITPPDQRVGGTVFHFDYLWRKR